MTTEVCVVGAGPAGSTVARRLAQLGRQVCLIERAEFPRPHVGESLPPSILPVLDQLGVRDRVEAAGFLRPDRSLTRWGARTDVATFGQDRRGFQVDRDRFDALLLEAARDAGVSVLQPAAVDRVRRDHDGLPVASLRGGNSVRAQFLIDATGRAGVLPRKRRRNLPPTAAIYAYWTNTPLAGTETRVEASPSAWYWGAPLASGAFAAAAFVAAERCRTLSAGQREHFYQALLDQSVLLAPCLRGTRLGPVRVCDAAPFVDEEPVGDRVLKIGEAAFAIDPLSSQGVQVAMVSGIVAAAVVHTTLCMPDCTALAQQFYRERVRDAAERHAQLAGDAYRSAGFEKVNLFWGPRAAAAYPTDSLERPARAAQPISIVSLSPLVQLEASPVLNGEFIVAGTVLRHPNVTPGLAFLAGVPLAPLLAAVSRPMPVGALLTRWMDYVPPEQCRRIFDWLLTRGVLEGR
jgi:flavin-dependent dehydrogenase